MNEVNQEDTQKKPGRRERRRQAKRDNMLDKAMAIVAKDGLDALTIAKLAKSLDAAVGALYRYFPSKSELLAALQRRALVDFHQVLLDELKNAESFITQSELKYTPRTLSLLRVSLSAETYYRDALREPSRHALIDAIMSTPQHIVSDEEAKKASKIIALILAPIEESLCLLLSYEREDILCKQKAHILWAIVHGIDHFRKRDRILPDALHSNTLLLEALRSLFLGWGIDNEEFEESIVLLRAYISNLGETGVLVSTYPEV